MLVMLEVLNVWREKMNDYVSWLWHSPIGLDDSVSQFTKTTMVVEVSPLSGVMSRHLWMCEIPFELSQGS